MEKTPKKKSRNLRDEVSPEDLAKVQRHQAATKGAYVVDDEWLLLTEFALKFGWQAYLDVKADNIPIAEMMTLIEASRKLYYKDMYRDAQTAFIGAGAVQSKKPGSTFKKMTKDILKHSKVSR